jgi:carbamoyltransferase
MPVLGITSFIHTSSAALVDDTGIVAAADQERFSRIKHDGSFPREAIAYCLDQAGLGLSDLSAVAFYWDPWRAIPQRIVQLLRNMPQSLAFFRDRVDEQAVRGDFSAWHSMTRVGSI